MTERTNEAFEEGIPLTVVGGKLQPGDAAPDFQLETILPGQGMPSPISLADSAGQIRVLNVINSIDTPVCQCETRRFEELKAQMGDGVAVYTVSMDLPFAFTRWQQAENVAHPALSAHKSEEFGRAYGVLLKEWRLLQRAVFVIDAAGKVRYADYIADQMQEPKYEPILEAVKQASSLQPR